MPAGKTRKSIESVRRIVQQYADTLKSNNILLEEVFLFGSYAHGRPKRDSDIDVAIVSGSLSGDRYDDRCQLMHLRWDVDLRIEPHPFRPEDFTEDNPEAAEIMRTGIRIL